MTTLQATYSIAVQLTHRTAIKVINGRPVTIRLNDHLYNFKSSKRIKGLFRETDAVVTIRGIWRDDPLYPFARKANIRVVEIDASRPFDPALTGVSVMPFPATKGNSTVGCRTDKVSPYIWLSLSNASKMAEIVALDLKRLSPKDAATIDGNLNEVKRRLFRLKADFEDSFAGIENLDISALTEKFVYLTADFNIHVVGYLVKDDNELTKNDLERLTRFLVENEVKVVIHQRSLNARIIRTVEQAGAKLVMLDFLDPGLKANGKLNPEGYFKLMEKNLSRLIAAFSRGNLS
ncbi:MAG: zinc ABC transporter substrate-binding protein [Proteobacteria bacterium]|nr:zinc ABC transporter substrate-binding protein [Pseudomonadota bacterium]